MYNISWNKIKTKAKEKQHTFHSIINSVSFYVDTSFPFLLLAVYTIAFKIKTTQYTFNVLYQQREIERESAYDINRNLN